MGLDGSNDGLVTSPTSSETTSPTRLPAKSLYSFEELDHLLDLIERSADDWMADPNSQSGALIYLSKGWEYMSPAQRERAWQICQNRLTRLRFIKDDQGNADPAGQHRTFQRIMSLTEETDVRAAAAVHPLMYSDYRSEAEEPAYEGVPGWLGDYIECVKHNQIPLAYHFWMGVLAMSVACRRNVYIDLSGKPLWMDQYMFLVGPRGNGKSDAMAYTRNVLTRMNGQLWDLDENKRKVPREEFYVNFLPEDSTQEHIVNEFEAISERTVRDDNLHATNIPMDVTAVLMLDEMSVHYGEDNWGAGKKTPFYTSLFGKGYCDKGTVKRGKQYIERLCFSMTGCSAPEWMRDVISPHVLKGGFVDRTLYIYRTHTHRCYDQFSRPIVDPLMMEELAAQLTYWAKPVLGLKRPALFTPAAQDWMRDRYRKDRMTEIKYLDEGRSTEGRISLVRSSNQVLRLAVVFSISDGMFPRIDIPHLERSISILTIEEGHFAEFLGEVRQTKFADNLDRIKEFFRENNWEAPISGPGSLRRHFRRTIGAKRVLQQYEDSLLDDGVLTKDARSDKAWYVWTGDK